MQLEFFPRFSLMLHGLGAFQHFHLHSHYNFVQFRAFFFSSQVALFHDYTIISRTECAKQKKTLKYHAISSKSELFFSLSFIMLHTIEKLQSLYYTLESNVCVTHSRIVFVNSSAKQEIKFPYVIPIGTLNQGNTISKICIDHVERTELRMRIYTHMGKRKQTERERVEARTRDTTKE